MTMTRQRAVALDNADPLAPLREQFSLARVDAEGLIYLDGNSLGRLPRSVVERVEKLVEEEWGTDLIRGWNKGSTFRLQNGQVWQVDGTPDNRFFPKRVDPEVELRPAGSFGGWKLYVQPEGLWVRVKRIK